MIKINDKTIASIYSGEKVIEKIYKGTLKVYEGWKNLIASGVPPLTLLNCKGVDLIDYKIYGNSEQRRLPNDYQEVEYIESTGTQFINTGFKANNNTRMVMDFKNTTPSNDGLYMLFGARNYYNNSGFGVSISSYGGYVYWANRNYANDEFRLNTKIRMIYDISKNGFIIGDTTLECDGSTFTGSYPITLLSLNSSTGYDTRYATGKIYSCQIYDNDVLVRDFVPCYRKSDDVIGLYDLVNGVFYENIGTGTFLKGDDVFKLSVGEYDETTTKYKIPVKVRGKNSFDIFDKVSGGFSPTVMVEQDGFVIAEYDNTNSTSLKYLNAFTKPKYSLKPDTNYLIVAEVLEITNCTISPISLWIAGNEFPQFTPAFNLTTVGTHLTIATTKSDFSEATSMLRTGVIVDAGTIGKAVFRISVLEDTSIKENDFVYEPYVEPKIIDIFLDEPLTINDYIDYKKQELSKNGVITKIELPNIPTIKGTTILEIDTTIQPSNLEVVYKGK